MGWYDDGSEEQWQAERANRQRQAIRNRIPALQQNLSLAAGRLKSANDELATAERKHREAREALEAAERDSSTSTTSQEKHERDGCR